MCIIIYSCIDWIDLNSICYIFPCARGYNVINIKVISPMILQNKKGKSEKGFFNSFNYPVLYIIPSLSILSLKSEISHFNL